MKFPTGSRFQPIKPGAHTGVLVLVDSTPDAAVEYVERQALASAPAVPPAAETAAAAAAAAPTSTATAASPAAPAPGAGSGAEPDAPEDMDDDE